MRATLILIGMFLVMIGFTLLPFTIIEEVKEVKYGGVIVIGPFPILFGNSQDMTLLAGILGIISLMVVLLIILSLRW
ncbi:MAG TPA: DUF131 domain-containing protein [Archaeoglobus profundus]|nr:DUF131 domain-containing protein [Archaeoglobus profundus]